MNVGKAVVRRKLMMIRWVWSSFGRVLALVALAMGFQGHAAAGALSPAYDSAGVFYGYRDMDTCVEWAAPGSFAWGTVRHDVMVKDNGVMGWSPVAEPQANWHRGGGYSDWRLPTMAEWTSFNRSISWCTSTSAACNSISPPQQLSTGLAAQPYWTSEVLSAQAAAAWLQTNRDALKMWYSRSGTALQVWPVRSMSPSSCVGTVPASTN